ncbi:Iron-binding ferritin-like antioxidant protein [Hyalangium minutum]|uniref:Iron-binding ferritin-like antioxidant protein n=2 Tax=Hyalangium minutum TaxID=394096 RepID=A0A085WHI6_9BACT|nr:Iron-binding ferritin-like antioxidant protein [Hyalangium minutum]
MASVQGQGRKGAGWKSTDGDQASPILRQRGKVLQRAGTLRKLPLGLSEEAKADSVARLNQVLVDTIVLRDMYKKHHWQTSGATFYQLHLLFDKHYEEQAELVDALAERIQLLGGVSLGMPHDVAELSKIERPPRDVEEPAVQLSRLLEAHEYILRQSREAARRASELGDEGTNDLLVSEVVRVNEMQVWFVSEHLVDVPLVTADQETAATSVASADVEPKRGEAPTSV